MSWDGLTIWTGTVRTAERDDRRYPLEYIRLKATGALARHRRRGAQAESALTLSSDTVLTAVTKLVTAAGLPTGAITSDVATPIDDHTFAAGTGIFEVIEALTRNTDTDLIETPEGGLEIQDRALTMQGMAFNAEPVSGEPSLVNSLREYRVWQPQAFLIANQFTIAGEVLFGSGLGGAARRTPVSIRPIPC